MMKKPKNPSMNVYCNYQLTNRRQGISFLMRKLKQERKIHAYVINENGQISFKTTETGKFFKTTYITEDNGRKKTLDEKDIRELLLVN